MKCVTSNCPRKGLRKYDGWCAHCYHGHTRSFERNLEDAERLAETTGRPWAVAELHPSSRAAIEAKKIGERAYGAYRFEDVPSMEKSGYHVVRVVHPKTRSSR